MLVCHFVCVSSSSENFLCVQRWLCVLCQYVFVSARVFASAVFRERAMAGAAWRATCNRRVPSHVRVSRTPAAARPARPLLPNSVSPPWPYRPRRGVRRQRQRLRGGCRITCSNPRSRCRQRPSGRSLPQSSRPCRYVCTPRLRLVASSRALKSDQVDAVMGQAPA